MNKLKDFLKLYIISLITLLQASMVLSKGQTRIVGGHMTSIEIAPYLVQIYKDRKFHCGGAMVTERHVVTAAHCVHDEHPVHFTVVGSTSKVNATGLKSTIARIIMHRDFRIATFHMDVAVIKLRKTVIERPAQPIGLCESDFNIGDSVQIYGWGKRKEGAGSIPYYLYTTTINVISERKCRELYNDIKNVTDSMFCATAPGQDACAGDSGGPAIINGKLCGVISWGYGCARPNYAGVFSNINKVSKFLKNALLQ